MANISTLESVAAMLPEPQRERFLKMAVRFRSVPDDDEFLQILEAVGFISLILKEIPSELVKILEGASPIQDSGQGLGLLVKEAVSDSIPSYEDLKRMAERFENHEIALNQLLRGQPDDKPKSVGHGLTMFVVLLIGITIGFATSKHIALFLE